MTNATFMLCPGLKLNCQGSFNTKGSLETGPKLLRIVESSKGFFSRKYITASFIDKGNISSEKGCLLLKFNFLPPYGSS